MLDRLDVRREHGGPQRGGAEMSSEPDDDDRQRTQPELPSVIVDPSLLGAGATAKTEDAPSGVQEKASPSPPAPSPAPLAPAEPTADENEQLEIAAERLSIQDADRFAASIRPSWEPPAAAPAPRASADARPLAASTPEPEDEPLPTLAFGGRMTKSRALSLTAAAIFAFGALVVFAVAGGETERPESWKASTTSPPSVTPTAPIASPVPAAVATPAPMPSAAATPPAPPEATSTPVAATPTPAAPAVPTAAPEAAPAPTPVANEPERVRLRIGTTPRSASLFIDGRSVANPLDASMPWGQEHRVEAKAPGYAPRSVKVTTDQHRTITLELERIRPPTKGPTAPAKRVASTTTKTATTKKPSTPKSAAPRSAGFVSDSPY